MAYAHVMNFEKKIQLLDLSQGPIEDIKLSADNLQVVAVGKYNERRPHSYTAAQYQSPAGAREYHVGVDLVASPGSPIFAFDDGEIFVNTIHDRPLDYGPTLITLHIINGNKLWALHGHLSADSIAHWKVGTAVKAGEKLAEVGTRQENGGWFPHLHFQLSKIAPLNGDLPGVVSADALARALNDFPDPRLVLGFIY